MQDKVGVELSNLLTLKQSLDGQRPKSRQHSASNKMSFVRLLDLLKDEYKHMSSKWAQLHQDGNFNPAFGKKIMQLLEQYNFTPFQDNISRLESKTCMDFNLTDPKTLQDTKELVNIIEAYMLDSYRQIGFYTLTRMFHKHTSRVIFYARMIISFLNKAGYRTSFESESKGRDCVMVPRVGKITFDTVSEMDVNGIDIAQGKVLVSDNSKIPLAKRLFFQMTKSFCYSQK